MYTSPNIGQADSITVTTSQSTAYNKNVVKEVRKITEKKGQRSKQNLGSYKQPSVKVGRGKVQSRGDIYSGNNNNVYHNDSNPDSPFSYDKRSETVTR